MNEDGQILLQGGTINTLTRDTCTLYRWIDSFIISETYISI